MNGTVGSYVHAYSSKTTIMENCGDYPTTSRSPAFESYSTTVTRVSIKLAFLSSRETAQNRVGESCSSRLVNGTYITPISSRFLKLPSRKRSITVNAWPFDPPTGITIRPPTAN